MLLEEGLPRLTVLPRARILSGLDGAERVLELEAMVFIHWKFGDMWNVKRKTVCKFPFYLCLAVRKFITICETCDVHLQGSNSHL